MWTGRTPNGLVPSVRALPYTTGQTFVKGDILKQTAGLLVISPATPIAGVVGIALQDVATNPGYQAANNPVTSTGLQQTVSVAMADNVTEFVAKFTNGSAVYIAPANTDIGVSYGVTVQNGVWTVDKAKVTVGTNTTVVITGVDITNQFVYFKFLASVIAGQ